MHPSEHPSPQQKGCSNDDANKTLSPRSALKRKACVLWTSAEDEALLRIVAVDQAQHMDGMGDEDWDAIAQHMEGKSAVQCLKRYMLLNKGNASSGASTPSRLVPNSPLTERERESRECETVDAHTAVQNEEDEDEEDYSHSSRKRPTSSLPPASEGAGVWTDEETDLLRKLVETYKDSAPRWNEVAANFASHTPIECLTQWQALTNPPVIKGKGSWTVEEDMILREKRQLYGRKWAKIASHLPGRQGKQCRERFVNHLDPELKKGEWTDDEEAILIAMHEHFGNRWANISKNLPGRSDNDVKNHWYSTIQRKFNTHGKEKLIEAAVQQVSLMQTMGTMPSQNASPFSPSSANTATTAAAAHPTLHAPPLPPMYPPGYPPYHFPSHQPPAMGQQSGAQNPWYQHHHHTIPPPHPYYQQQFQGARAGGGKGKGSEEEKGEFGMGSGSPATQDDNDDGHLEE